MLEPLFTVFRCTKRRGMSLDAHVHAQAQLTYAASGMVQIHTDAGRWLVPPQLAVWMPVGVEHRLELLSDAELWMVHWQPSAILKWAPPTLHSRPFALRVTSLLHSLLSQVFSPDTGPAKGELIAQLMLHELTATAHAPTFLPMPSSPVGRRIAELSMADQQNRLDLSALALRAASSIRTVSRLFPIETGLSFKVWRQRARILHAMDGLARGDSIARVASGCGFASTAAFSAAFRQVTGTTPTTFLSTPLMIDGGQNSLPKSVTEP